MINSIWPKRTGTILFFLLLAFSTVPSGGDEAHFFILGDDSFRFIFSAVHGWHWASEVWSGSISEDLIKTAKENGITAFHLMLPIIEKELGIFREAEFEKLDAFLDLCSNHGVYVMISFLQGHAMAIQKEDPYYHPQGIEGLIKNNALKDAFKERIRNVVGRTNSVNGKEYRYDSSILAWIIIEEPISAPWNYPGGPPDVTISELQNWFSEMAELIRGLDPFHLITVNTTAAVDNLGDDWPEMFNIPALDFYYVEDADARIIEEFPDIVADDYPLRLLAHQKPMLVMLSFTSGIWNQDEISGDYVRQAQILDETTNGYLAEGFAGVGYWYWGTVLYNNLYEPHIPPNTLPYCYNPTFTLICNMMRSQAEKLGALNWPYPPLKFVTITPVRFELEINTTEGGTTNPPPGKQSLDLGQDISIEAVPYETFVFDRWVGDIETHSNPVILSMFSDKTVTAVFRHVYAPVNISGEKKINRSLSQAEYINVLEWEANPLNSNIDIHHYRIYQIQDKQSAAGKRGIGSYGNSGRQGNNGLDENKTLIAELAAGVFQYRHRGVEKDRVYSYAIVAVTGEGREGLQARITVGR